MNSKAVLLLLAVICSLFIIEAAGVSTKDCKLPIQKGRCKAYMPRYAYDSSVGACVQFIYGGCEGNNNNFKTHLDCESVCRSLIAA